MPGIDPQNVNVSYQQILQNLKSLSSAVSGLRDVVNKVYTEVCVLRNETKEKTTSLKNDLTLVKSQLEEIEEQIVLTNTSFLNP